MLSHEGRHRELSGGEPATTNNRMELRAAIEALQALREPCAVEFFTDSEYVRQGVTSWMAGWKMNGWRTRAKKPVKNEDLWRALDAAASRHQVTWNWLKGHAGHPENERCDVLATQAIAHIRETHTPDQLATALAEFLSRTAPPASHLDLFGQEEDPLA